MSRILDFPHDTENAVEARHSAEPDPWRFAAPAGAVPGGRTPWRVSPICCSSPRPCCGARDDGPMQDRTIASRRRFRRAASAFRRCDNSSGTQARRSILSGFGDVREGNRSSAFASPSDNIRRIGETIAHFRHFGTLHRSIRASSRRRRSAAAGGLPDAVPDPSIFWFGPYSGRRGAGCVLPLPYRTGAAGHVGGRWLVSYALAIPGRDITVRPTTAAMVMSAGEAIHDCRAAAARRMRQ